MSSPEVRENPYYLTDCPIYGDKDVPAKYFLWVKETDCEACKKPFDLFPGYLLSEDARHPKNVLVCFSCGELNEVESLDRPGSCRECKATLRVDGPAKRSRCVCPHCGQENTYLRPEAGPPRHRMFGIEYYNPARKEENKGRFFKKPDVKDLARYEEAEKRWAISRARFVPEQPILPGDETDRLHRWGYQHYRDLFNARQLLGLELSARHISEIKTERVRHALATNLSDLLRYQNMLCRYDTMALKSLDVFSVHGFPVGLVQCESGAFRKSRSFEAGLLTARTLGDNGRFPALLWQGERPWRSANPTEDQRPRMLPSHRAIDLPRSGPKSETSNSRSRPNAATRASSALPRTSRGGSVPSVN